MCIGKVWQKDQLLADVERLTDSLGPLPEPEAKPTLIAISGLPGTGKSYFCGKLGERLLFLILESDALRKTLFSPPSYRQEESMRLFRAIHVLMERLLRRGVSVILDATNLSERYRERLYNIADRLNAKLILVRVEAPPELVRERLKARVANPEAASGADWEVYEKMKSSVEKISRQHYVVDTSRDITPVLSKIVRQVRKRE